MKNRKQRIKTDGLRPDTAVDGSTLGLFVFVAIAVWLFLFESNPFL